MGFSAGFSTSFSGAAFFAGASGFGFGFAAAGFSLVDRFGLLAGVTFAART